MDPVAQFATNLRAARLAAGLSQEALGDACNLHRTEVSLLERAGREPRLRTITKLARALDLRPAACSTTSSSCRVAGRATTANGIPVVRLTVSKTSRGWGRIDITGHI